MDSLSSTPAPSFEELSQSEFLNVSPAVFLSLFEVNYGLQAFQKSLFILGIPEFDVIVLKELVESLQQCKAIYQSGARRNSTNADGEIPEKDIMLLS